MYSKSKIPTLADKQINGCANKDIMSECFVIYHRLKNTFLKLRTLTKNLSST